MKGIWTEKMCQLSPEDIFQNKWRKGQEANPYSPRKRPLNGVWTGGRGKVTSSVIKIQLGWQRRLVKLSHLRKYNCLFGSDSECAINKVGCLMSVQASLINLLPIVVLFKVEFWVMLWFGNLAARKTQPLFNIMKPHSQNQLGHSGGLTEFTTEYEFKSFGCSLASKVVQRSPQFLCSNTT